jgi:hypothetical protein
LTLRICEETEVSGVSIPIEDHLISGYGAVFIPTKGVSMSLATCLPDPTIANQSRNDDWVTLAEACRILGRNANAVKSIALNGSLRYKAIPGARVLYSRHDALRLAASR